MFCAAPPSPPATPPASPASHPTISQRAIEQLMAMEITPIVNENDVVSCEEAKVRQLLEFSRVPVRAP